LNNKISDKDKKDWEDFLSDNDPLPNKDLNIFSKKEKKEILCDLHGFTLEDANKEIEKLISSSYESGVNRLVVVTGKGLHSNNEKDPYKSKEFSILKHSVPEYIRSNQDLMKSIIEIKEATLEDGGSGAFYIYLKKKL
tara:strand:- start:995 stop:1408 length:414 start_codon:yes stop_codon:yes gene_type:complete